MSSRDFVVRRLMPGEGAAYRKLRFAALENAPLAFSSSPEDEAHLSDVDFEARISLAEPDAVFGVFGSGALVGVATFIAEKRRKTRHKGAMYGVYVDPDWRGTGAAQALVRQVIDHATTRGLALHAHVIADNASALRLYLGLGFVSYGVEPRALLVDGVFYDEQLLIYQPRG
ncbi:ribosomal protein S18 acetylase RimI-like enzyme [Aminobacter lissarensis]|uniref:Ribosomal protein S18 acetylase RimI-like enzyme n=1 Tax=Aminobacter carboxidus TaxID=376165 RepID=A0A8E1WE43_9HYPH|nr:GNAT family N-acetyltransferase [Aminobacter lissarensis]MBB6465747.1 ribosomal protein S18 acetylase RimI-like enzyme [Aminobacter lissarensis]